jgi:peptidoglycan hydrolase CwlO-like protein
MSDDKAQFTRLWAEIRNLQSKINHLQGRMNTAEDQIRRLNTEILHGKDKR